MTEQQQLFPWDVREPVVRPPAPGVVLVDQPHDYQLLTFLRTPPSYHIVKAVTEYGSADTWCGKTGRVLSIESSSVPRCTACEEARTV